MIINPRFKSLFEALDQEKMRKTFQNHLINYWGRGLSVTRCTAEQIFPKPDQVWIKYQLGVKTRRSFPPEQIILYGQHYLNGLGRGNSQLLNKLGLVAFYSADLDLVVPVFPADLKLPQLAPCCSSAFMKKYFEEVIFPAQGKNYRIKSCAVQIQSYRLEKRCSLCYDLEIYDLSKKTNGKIKIQAKVSTPALTRDLYDRVLSLNESEVFRPDRVIKTPRLLHYSRELSAIFFEHIPGRSLHRIYGNPQFLSWVRQLPKFLTWFQSQSVTLEKQHTLSDEMSIIKDWHQNLRLFFPGLNNLSAKAYRRIRDLADSVRTRELAPTHRDFYDKQILKNGRYLYVIDWDLACLADPALDPGNFLAHLELRRFQHPELGTTLTKAKEIFSQNLNSHFGRNQRRSLKFYKLSSLFRLACVYAFRPKWHFLARPLLNQYLNSN